MLKISNYNCIISNYINYMNFYRAIMILKRDNFEHDNVDRPTQFATSIYEINDTFCRRLLSYEEIFTNQRWCMLLLEIPNRASNKLSYRINEW